MSPHDKKPKEATESKTGSSGSLQKVGNPITARSLMAEAVLTQARAIVLGLPEQTIGVEGKVTSEEDGKSFFWIEFPIENLAPHFKKLSQLTLPYLLKVNLFIRETPILTFETSVVQIDDHKFRFKIPNEIYYSKKRKSRRFKIPAAYEFYIDVPDRRLPTTRVKRRLYDISYNGLCFLVGQNESRLFNVGVKLTSVHLTLRGRMVSIDMTIKGVGNKLIQLGDSFGVTIGTEFNSLSPEAKDVIESYLDECFSRAQTTRRLLD